jgi:hypothetical protein
MYKGIQRPPGVNPYEQWIKLLNESVKGAEAARHSQEAKLHGSPAMIARTIPISQGSSSRRVHPTGNHFPKVEDVQGGGYGEGAHGEVANPEGAGGGGQQFMDALAARKEGLAERKEGAEEKKQNAEEYPINGPGSANYDAAMQAAQADKLKGEQQMQAARNAGKQTGLAGLEPSPAAVPAAPAEGAAMPNENELGMSYDEWKASQK